MSSNSTSSSSSSTTTTPIKGGELQVSVLSINNLPLREPSPSHVSLTACGETSATGPLLSRHKDSNSFKFTNSSSHPKEEPTNHTMIIRTKTLQQLYEETNCTVRIVYENQDSNNNNNLQATFSVKELKGGVNQDTNVRLELDSDENNKRDKDGSFNNDTPTIQLQILLRGPLRREMHALSRFGHSWFAMMDALERNVYRLVPTKAQWLLTYAAVPALLATLLLTPLVAGVMTIFLPLLAPMLAMVVTSAACLAVAFLLVYTSTSRGRQKIVPVLKPAIDTILQSTPGQALLYPVGPRPTVVSCVELAVPPPEYKYTRLVLSIMIDIVGCSSYLLPFMGEASDALWAPIQTILIMAMYDTTTPKLKYLSFVEEMLPFTDVIPSATIGWAAQYGPQLMGRGDSSKKDKDKKQ